MSSPNKYNNSTAFFPGLWTYSNIVNIVFHLTQVESRSKQAEEARVYFAHQDDRDFSSPFKLRSAASNPCLSLSLMEEVTGTINTHAVL